MKSIKEYPDKLNDLAEISHQVAKDRGFYNEGRILNHADLPVAIMQVVMELSEAVDAYRKGKHVDRGGYDEESQGAMPSHGHIVIVGPNGWRLSPAQVFEKHVKDSVEDEIADAFIKLLDIAGNLGMDLDWHVRMKLDYNSVRGVKVPQKKTK